MNKFEKCKSCDWEDNCESLGACDNCEFYDHNIDHEECEDCRSNHRDKNKYPCKYKSKKNKSLI